MAVNWWWLTVVFIASMFFTESRSRLMRSKREEEGSIIEEEMIKRSIRLQILLRDPQVLVEEKLKQRDQFTNWMRDQWELGKQLSSDEAQVRFVTIFKKVIHDLGKLGELGQISFVLYQNKDQNQSKVHQSGQSDMSKVQKQYLQQPVNSDSPKVNNIFISSSIVWLAVLLFFAFNILIAVYVFQSSSNKPADITRKKLTRRGKRKKKKKKYRGKTETKNSQSTNRTKNKIKISRHRDEQLS